MFHFKIKSVNENDTILKVLEDFFKKEENLKIHSLYDYKTEILNLTCYLQVEKPLLVKKNFY